MTEAFLKSLRWFILVIFIVIGTSALMIMEESGSIRPLIITVLSYGICYIMSFFWREFRKKLLFFSVVVFSVLSVVSYYVPDMMYVFFGYAPNSFNPYYMWGATMVAGIPIMMIAFYKYD